jgi:NADH dehydrogenase
VIRGEGPKEYKHKNLGAVAGLGVGVGAFQSGKIAIKGVPAWLAHRGYHGLAIPSWERKIRVVLVWVANFFLGRDIVSLEAVQTPRAAFEQYASRPKPPAEAAPAPAAAPKAAAAKAPAAKAPRAPRKTAAKPAEASGATAVQNPSETVQVK